MKLSLHLPKIYRVKRGQTVSQIASVFGVAPVLLAQINSLERELCGGEVLLLPPRGNAYTVQGGESKSLLCGSEENFLEYNGTAAFYPGQRIILPPGD